MNYELYVRMFVSSAGFLQTHQHGVDRVPHQAREQAGQQPHHCSLSRKPLQHRRVDAFWRE